MKKILIIYGTRPEAIKLALLVSELKQDNHIEVLNTQQHSSIDLVFAPISVELDPLPNSIKKVESLGHRNITILKRIEKKLNNNDYDYVLVQGDTVSAYSGALLALYRHIKIIYVESGLRTYSYKNPFPEEFYRQSISHMASYHFCPNNIAADNLRKEGVNKNIWVVGNIIDDEIFKYKEKLNTFTKIKQEVLITIHRKENVEHYFSKIVQLIKAVAKQYPEINFKWITHPSVDFSSEMPALKNVMFINPQSHETFLFQLRQSICVFTDSGGIQEESVRLSTPALVLRESTERIEELSQGNYLIKLGAPNTKVQIFDIINKLNQIKIKRPAIDNLPSVSKHIASIIREI